MTRDELRRYVDRLPFDPRHEITLALDKLEGLEDWISDQIHWTEIAIYNHKQRGNDGAVEKARIELDALSYVLRKFETWNEDRSVTE